jgi:hypothetical protein
MLIVVIVFITIKQNVLETPGLWSGRENTKWKQDATSKHRLAN